MTETETALSVGGHALPSSIARPPQVDVLIVNCNYAAFIGQAIDSLLAQTYGGFRCLIIDNGSSDDSVAVARRHIGDDPRFDFLLLDRNLGHSGGALAGLAATENEFVVFLDADDMLLPQFLACHLQVHLAGKPVGLSTNDVLEVDTNSLALTGRLPAFGLAPTIERDVLAAAEAIALMPGLSREDYDELRAVTAYLPRSTPGWHWGPGTANMFRRSVANLFILQERGEPIFGGMDCQLNSICHGATGSMLVRKVLSVRRLHGQNDFALMPHLTNLHSGRASYESIATRLRQRVLTTAMQRVGTLAECMPAELYFGLFDQVASCEPSPPKFLAALEPEIARHYDGMAAAYGEDQLFRQLFRRYSLDAMQRILQASGNVRESRLRRLRGRRIKHRLKGLTRIFSRKR